MKTANIPTVKLGVVAVSRDCVPIALSTDRKNRVCGELAQSGVDAYNCPTTVENEKDMEKALEEVRKAGCNALVVYLGNFGPETPETLLAKYFTEGPVMFAAAAEDAADKLCNDRGDAYCGMLNCSYNLALRNIRAYIPPYPVGTPEEVAGMILEFIPIARCILGLRNLKLITFGPRPQDFLACNAPIKCLYELGVEIEENSELDLFASFNAHAEDERIDAVAEEMAKELGGANKIPEILKKLAQYEITLEDWIEGHKGHRNYVAMANKCWPAFQTEFKFVPCYVNSRLVEKGIPVACETDIWGALSEYIGICASEDEVTLLDINNSVPSDMYQKRIEGVYDYAQTDTFMGFHCGNTPITKLKKADMRNQKIMARTLPEEYTFGTLEGDLAPADITFFRLQSTADARLRAYVAEGEVLPVDTESFGSIGVFAIPEMGRFYRNVLIGKNYPHHGAVAFGHYGKILFEVFKYLGVEDVAFNQPKGMMYPGENPFI